LASKKNIAGDSGEDSQIASLISDLDRLETESIIQDERLTKQEKSKTRSLIIKKRGGNHSSGARAGFAHHRYPARYQ